MPTTSSRIFHRQFGRDYPRAVEGRGLYIRDAEGREYLDASGGAAVSCLGHGHPDVRAAMHAQLDRLEYAHTGAFTTDVAEELAADLVSHAPEGLSYAYFLSGGSEATEAALKLARQYFVERGETGRRHFVARRQSYHGNTLGALAVGGNELRRRAFAPLLIDTHHVSPCFAYRGQHDGESDDAYGTRLADELDATFTTLGAGTVIAFLAETVVGATTGAVPPVAGYFQKIQAVCRRHGVLLILDEVMCGMGRTGSLYACTDDGVTPDLLTVAKGLGGGYAAIGALLASDAVVETIRHGSGVFQHGHTYVGHPVACAAALAVQQVMRRDRLVENVAVQGRYLADRLADRFAAHPHVGDIRGRGLLQAIELVRDRATEAPFAPELAVNARIKQAAMARELMVYPMGGTIDGRFGDHVMLAPPFIVEAADIDRIVERLGDAVDAALAGLPSHLA